jgi:glycine cleavage system H protein
MTPAPETLFFKKSHFVTHLPVQFRYSRSHFWSQKREGSRLRLGFTKFATRMLGEIVDYNFDILSGAPVSPGQVLGWVEGFKAISDVISIGQGSFVGANQALQEDSELITRAPYAEGWLYEMDGQLDDQTLDVQGYVAHLNVTLDRLQEKNSAGDKLPNSPQPDSL